MNVFDPHIHIKEVILVGTGGTGAQLARSIARLAYDMGRARLHVPAIRFIDPDTVDEGNIGRQLFSYGDLGQNKAHVLAARFNAALGLSISCEFQRNCRKIRDSSVTVEKVNGAASDIPG